MFTARTLRSLSLASALLAAGCGPFHRGGSGSNSYIRFVNQSIDQVDVYAVPVAGDQIRLATVNGNATQRITLPASAIGPDGMVNIVARVFASNRTPRTGRVSIGPGQGIEVTLPSTQNTLTVLPITR